MPEIFIKRIQFEILNAPGSVDTDNCKMIIYGFNFDKLVCP